MNTLDISRRSIGVNFGSGGAEVAVWAPKAKQVEMLLREDDKVLALLPSEYGYWTLNTHDVTVGTQYKFILDKDKKLPDPASLSQPEGVHGFSQAMDLGDFKWSDAGWDNLLLEEYVIYELHIGTFSTEGSFAAIEEKIPYLKDLGITAVEIMPVAQFPGDRNWGYDGVYPYAVQHSYGGAEGLQHLVNLCHKNGLAVILDVVYNHIGPEGNYLGEYGYYFTSKYITPWGDAINFDDAWCDGVRKYFIENALMWFRDFHIDALRMDAVHAIKDFSPDHILREIKIHVDELMKLTGRTHHLIVECDLNDTRFIDPLEERGYGMDGQWMDEFHHALRVTAGNERTGYYSDFDGLNHLAKSYKDVYVYDGIYSPHRLKTFGTKAENNSAKQFVVFSQNHDQVGNRMLGERTSRLVSFEMQKLMAGSVLVSPFIPLLFMGEEWSEPHPFLYFVSHTDPELAEAVRKGRKAEFAAFQAQGEAPDPMAEETFNESRLQWELIGKEPHKAMISYYKALIALRKGNEILKRPDKDRLEVVHNEEHQILTLHRWHNNGHVVCLMNFSKEVQTIQMPAFAGNWYLLLNSADPEWNGPGVAPGTLSAGDKLTQQPESIIIYSGDHV